MENKFIKIMFLIIALLLLVMGTVNATDVTTNDTSTSTQGISDATTATTTAGDINLLDESSSNDNQQTGSMENKNTKITKQKDEEKTAKTASTSKTYNVTNYNTLHSALTNNTYSTVTLNINSNIKLTGNTFLAEAIKKLTINGNGKTINGNGQYQFLNLISTSDVTINNLKITNCYDQYSGGAINKENGILTIKNTTFSKNYAGDGGAINNKKGTLTVLNSIFTQNSALYCGAIKNTNGEVIINNTNFTHNTASDGGAIYNNDKLTIDNSLLSYNNATYGGAINNQGTLISIKTDYTKNSVTNDGGAIFTNNNLTLYGGSFNSNDAKYGGAINNRGILIIDKTIFSHNTAIDGGAIHNNGILTIDNGFLSYNNATYGGAINNQGTLISLETHFTKNFATDGGVIYNNGQSTIVKNILTSNSATYGGAIKNIYGTVSIDNSVFITNTATDGAIIHNNYYGNVTILNSYLDNNTAENGGIYTLQDITVKNSTFTGNTQIMFIRFANGTYDISLNEKNGFISSSEAEIFVDNISYGKQDIINNYIDWNGMVSDGLHEIALVVNNNTKIILNLKFTESDITRNVWNYNQLINAVENAKYIVCPNYIIKIQENSSATENIIWGNSYGVTNLIIRGNGKIVDGNNAYNFMRINSGYSLELNNLKIKNFKSSENGGIIHNNYGVVKITNCEITDNSAKNGGAIYNNYGSLVITNTDIRNNTANENGGAIYNRYVRDQSVINFNITKRIADIKINTTEKITLILKDETKVTIKVNYTEKKVVDFAKNNTSKVKVSIPINITENLGEDTTIYETLNFTVNLNGAKNFIKNVTLNVKGITVYIPVNITVELPGTEQNSYGDLTIVNSNIVNNIAQNGGAIYNIYDETVDIDKTNIIINDGNIVNNYGTLSILDSNISNNLAREDGGAIYNEYHREVRLNNTNITQNKGYIINSWGSIEIDKTQISNNTAKYGGAVYNNYNRTLTNKAKVTEKGTIYTSEGILIISHCDITNNTAKEGSAIAVYGQSDNLIIQNNTFNSNYANTTGKAIKNTTCILIENNTNNKSFYSSTIYTRDKNTNVISNTFIDTEKETTLTYNKIPTTKQGENINITGQLLSHGKGVADKTVQIKVNDKTYNATTDKNGLFTLKYKASTTGKNNITFTFKKDDEYLKSTNKTTFTVKVPTWIKMGYMGNAKYGSTVKLAGRMMNATSYVKYVNVTVTVNDKVYQVKSNGAGYFYVNHTVDSYDVQKVTFRFAGNSLYLASSNSSSFKVKQPTWIKMGYQANVEYGSTVKLLGRLLNGTTAVKYVQVNVTVNGKVYQVKTDGAGYIRLNYTVDSYDVQKVTFRFAGNSLYLASSNSTSFKVKQPTIIKHASIANVKVGKTVKIVGRILYNETNSVKYVPVNVKVNGKDYQLKTDGAGYFRLNYTTTTAGVNNITSSFNGNTLYLASTNSTKFTVVKS